MEFAIVVKYNKKIKRVLEKQGKQTKICLMYLNISLIK